MKRFIGIAILFCTVSITTVQAQTSNHDPVKQIVEYIINVNSDTPSDVEELSNHFTHLRTSPIAINDTTNCELEKLQILTDFQIESVIDYIKANGYILSLNEITYIPGFDNELAELISPFISLNIPEKKHLTLSDIKRVRTITVARASYTFQRARGFSDTTDRRYQGNRPYYAIASNIKLGKSILINLHSEKDAGERSEPKRAFLDSFGGSILVLEPVKWVPRVVFGDYRLNLGQGLLSWSSFSMGKGNDPALVRKKPNINSCKSFDEINFYRGAAIELLAKPFLLTIAASNRWLDGHLSTTDSTGIVVVPSGLHRTTKEMEERSSVHEKMLAASVTYLPKRGRVSINLFNKERELQQLSSKEQGMSIDFHKQILGYTFFGEVATDRHRNVATIIGSTVRLSYQTFFTASIRNYPKEFWVKSNRAFGENSNANNEKGLYVGFKYVPRYPYTIITFVDLFESPAPKYRVSKPSDGAEMGISLSGIISPGIEGRIRLRYKEKELDVKQASGIGAQTERVKNYKADIKIKHTPCTNLEVELFGTLNHYTTETQKPQLGYLTSIDLQYDINRTPIRLYTRFSVFDAPTWDVALYCYENDLPGMYASSSFFRRGSRSYLMVKAKVKKHLSLWLKVAETIYASEVKEISEGMDRIRGNRKTDIRIQATLDL